MQIKILLALCLALLLTGCAGGTPSDSTPPPTSSNTLTTPFFPEEYELTFHLEAYEGEKKTSYSQFTAIRTKEGFFCTDSTGESYLFLCQPSGLYHFYIRHPETGEMVRNEDILLTPGAAENLQDLLCDLELLVRDIAGLTETGDAKVRGRPCRIFQGQQPAGSHYESQRTYYIDTETGLALQQSIHYRAEDGRIFSYIVTCENFQTGNVALPESLLPK